MAKRTEPPALPAPGLVRVRCMHPDWHDPVGAETDATPLEPGVIYDLPEGDEFARLERSGRIMREPLPEAPQETP